MPVYYVGIREVHVNTVEVESDTPLSREEVIKAAKDKVETLDFLDLEYSHQLDEAYWSVEEE